MSLIPPQDMGAEMSVLGSILLGGIKQYTAASKHVSYHDFYNPANGHVFRIMGQMVTDGISIDIVTLRDAVVSDGCLKEYGGVAYLIEVGEFVPFVNNAEHYAKIVKSKATLRRVIEAARELARAAYSQEVPPEEIIDSMTGIAITLSDSMTGEGHKRRTTVREALTRMHKSLWRDVIGFRTGLSAWDDVRTLVDGEMTLICARAGRGKTAIALFVALRRARAIRDYNKGKPSSKRDKRVVVIATSEMTVEQLTRRLVFHIAKINNKEVEDRQGFTDDEQKRYDAAVLELDSLPLEYIDDESGLTVEQVCAEARTIHSETPIALLVVDYLQNLLVSRENRRKDGSESNDIDHVSRTLKNLCRGLNIHVLCIAMEARSKECEVRGSDGPRGDAANIFYMHQIVEQDFSGSGEYKPAKIKMEWVKARDGDAGVATKLDFDKRYGSFSDANAPGGSDDPDDPW